MDVIYEKMKDDTECLIPQSKEESEIRKFYAGKTIFLTGSTGYIGKCVMEKLLRSCPEVSKIYTLVRPKKEKTVEERMNHYFQEIIFDRVRKINPNCTDKVVVIQGDLKESNLGLSPDDRQRLIDDVDIIIHNGASVYFKERISVSLQTNVLGTQRVLELASECKHVESFMYVSTAYSHFYQKNIDEIFYPPPGDLKMAHDIIKADTENESGLTDAALRDLRGQWSNTYVFTKSMAEGLVERYARTASFRCGVYRPAIVLSTWKESLAGWCGNNNGPLLPLTGIALGIVHVVPVRKEAKLDLVPADMTANALLATIWDRTVHREPKETVVYNYGSSVANPLRMKMLKDLNSWISEVPSMKNVWCMSVFQTNCIFNFYIWHIFLHFIPGLILDLVLLCQGKKPTFVYIFLKSTGIIQEFRVFVTSDWNINVTEMLKVCDRMNSVDKEEFLCDIRALNWENYFLTFWPGIRQYLLKDPMDTLEAARKRYRLMERAQTCIVALLVLTFAYYMYRLASYAMNF